MHSLCVSTDQSKINHHGNSNSNLKPEKWTLNNVKNFIEVLDLHCFQRRGSRDGAGIRSPYTLFIMSCRLSGSISIHLISSTWSCHYLEISIWKAWLWHYGKEVGYWKMSSHDVDFLYYPGLIVGGFVQIVRPSHVFSFHCYSWNTSDKK